MKRPENLLFTLYAHRVGIITREQLLLICQSLRHGKDIDIGQSLAKRGVIDDRQAEAIWNLVACQVDIIGTAKKALQSVEAGELILQAIWAAIQPQPAAKNPSKNDPPTIQLD